MMLIETYHAKNLLSGDSGYFSWHNIHLAHSQVPLKELITARVLTIKLTMNWRIGLEASPSQNNLALPDSGHTFSFHAAFLLSLFARQTNERLGFSADLAMDGFTSYNRLR